MRPASCNTPHNAKYHNNMATEENKKKIVETALQMFNSRGVRGVTMDDIASAMHISKRTLYESFANKEELLFECMMLVRDEITNLHKQSYCTVDEPLLMAVYMVRVNAMSNFKYKHLKEEIIRYYPEINEQFRELLFPPDTEPSAAIRTGQALPAPQHEHRPDSGFHHQLRAAQP